jgi:hypothetical protein
MKTRVLGLLVLICAGGLALSIGQSAFACDVDSLDRAICVSPRRPTPTKRVSATLRRATAVPTRTAVPTAPAPRGDSPWTAIDADDQWRTIPASSSIWYKLDGLPVPHLLQVWLDANGRKDVGFAVYGPDQIRNLTDSKPVGRGTFNRNLDHDLYWQGTSAIEGAWYALVANYAPVPLQHRIGFNKAGVQHTNCRGYWENIGPHRVYWTT